MQVRHRLWLTYDWDDNEGKDVDFVVSELEAAGLIVLLDRTKLKAGLRLWDQIGAHISDPKTHGWCIFATQNSLGNEKCREELSYALDRALNDRGQGRFTLLPRSHPDMPLKFAHGRESGRHSFSRCQWAKKTPSSLALCTVPEIGPPKAA